MEKTVDKTVDQALMLTTCLAWKHRFEFPANSLISRHSNFPARFAVLFFGLLCANKHALMR